MTNTAHKLATTPLVDESYYAAVTEALRTEAVKLLTDGTVAAVVGYKAGRRKNTALPAIATSVDEAKELVFSPACVNNLALYLTKAKKEVQKKGKLAIIAKGCDLKALAGLMGERQLKRDEVYIIGIACAGVYGANADRTLPLCEATIANKCRECTVHEPVGTDAVAGTLPTLTSLTPLEAQELARLEALTPAERWAFWKDQFSKCIKCLACRQVCPFCFCEQCLCDRNRPQAVETTPRPAGNMGWHIVRAMHLAGRCAGCAECERVCPMDIPLNLLNRKMAQELKELYGQEAGMTPQDKGPLAQYREDDDQSFIK
ncbi:MAG TPA: Fe-S oxidoreductase [Geobacteraceae bacterium]